MSVRWPMDTDLPDALVLGLTARHLLLAAPGLGALVLGTWLLVAHALPAWACVAGMLAAGAVTVVLVAENPDGMTWDRWLAALVRFRRSPRLEVAADRLAPLPGWAQAGKPEKVAGLDLPWGTPTPEGIPLGRDQARTNLGRAIALLLSPLDDTSLEPDAVAQVVAALESWLSSLDCPAQILVRSRPLQLADRIAALQARAAATVIPALAAIATGRAEALTRVQASNVRTLQAWLVLRAPDASALAERVRRAADLLAGAGVKARAATPAEMAELLGGKGMQGAPDSPAGWPGPAEIERVDPEVLRVGDRWCATLRAVTYPPAVEPGWLTPVLRADVDLDLAVHVLPEDPVAAVAALRRQHGRMASTTNLQEEGGDLADPRVSVATSDARRLHLAVGTNETRTFRAGLYVTVWAGDPDALAGAVEEVTTRASGLSLDLRAVVFSPLQAWIGTRALALDLVAQTWRVDTQALAAALPVWTGEVASDPGGSLAGFHAFSGAPVFVDRFALDTQRANAHKLAVAPSGRGKSYEIKQEIVSLLLEGVAVRVVDLENEYVRLAEALGGTVVRLGTDGARVNPFELAEAGEPEAPVRQALFVEALAATLLGEMSTTEQAQLARAVTACYRLAGIGADPASHSRTPPELLDLQAALQDEGATALADRLDAWTVGAHAGLLSGQTTTPAEGELVVWALGDLPGESDRMLAVAVLLVVHAVWSEIARQDQRRRVVVLDEAWRIWETSAAAGRVLDGLARRLAKGARKYNAGLTNATQDLEEFAATPLGRTILNNSAIKWLPGQEEGALKALAATFGLTGPETRFLAGCPRGQGLLLAGRQRVRLQVRATPAEHRLATSDPGEVARIDAEELRTAAEAAVGAYLSSLVAAAEGVPGLAPASAIRAPGGASATPSPYGRPLACRHRIAGLDGDWLAGRADAVVEVTWSAGGGAWGEVLHLGLVRRVGSWVVADAHRAFGGDAA